MVIRIAANGAVQRDGMHMIGGKVGVVRLLSSNVTQRSRRPARRACIAPIFHRLGDAAGSGRANAQYYLRSTEVGHERGVRRWGVTLEEVNLLV